MKRVLLVLTAVLLSVGVAYAAEDVRNTKHNLSSTGSLSPYLTTTTDEVCVFCHTPHFASIAEAPLWNRTEPTGPYNMYSSATIDMTIAGSPQGVSLACLSCHDGTVAFDSLVNEPGSGLDTIGTWSWNNNGNIMTSSTSPSAMIGTDLTNDHPISITYDTTKDPQFRAPVNNRIAVNGTNVTLPLYGSNKDQVECGSCHNPHEKDVATFLRVANTGSQLCLACHIK